MQRIDENTYIDDTLVTCAEYQLFIDEMREQGKYYQPDHWTSYQFPEGQAREPILGVRHSYALEFCKWLTSHDGTEWMFRLPTQKEADAFSIKLFGVGPLGYWNEINFTWMGVNPSNPRNINIHDFIDRDLDLARHREIEFTSLNLDLARGLALTLVRDLDRNIRFSPEINHDIDSVLTRHFEIDFVDHSKPNVVRIHNLSRDSKIAVDLALARYFDFNLHNDLDRARALALSLNYEHALDIDHAVNLAHFLSRTFEDPINSTIASRIRPLAFDIYIDVLTLRERIAGRSPAFEGIRLVKERTR